MKLIITGTGFMNQRKQNVVMFLEYLPTGVFFARWEKPLEDIARANYVRQHTEGEMSDD